MVDFGILRIIIDLIGCCSKAPSKLREAKQTALAHFSATPDNLMSVLYQIIITTLQEYLQNFHLHSITSVSHLNICTIESLVQKHTHHVIHHDVSQDNFESLTHDVRSFQ